MKQHVLPQVTAETGVIIFNGKLLLSCNQPEINLCLGHKEVLNARQKLMRK